MISSFQQRNPTTEKHQSFSRWATFRLSPSRKKLNSAPTAMTFTSSSSRWSSPDAWFCRFAFFKLQSAKGGSGCHGLHCISLTSSAGTFTSSPVHAGEGRWQKNSNFTDQKQPLPAVTGATLELRLMEASAPESFPKVAIATERISVKMSKYSRQPLNEARIRNPPLGTSAICFSPSPHPPLPHSRASFTPPIN